MPLSAVTVPSLHSPGRAAEPGFDIAAAAAAIRHFLGQSTTVTIAEGGERLGKLRAQDSGFSIRTDTGRLVCHFWSSDLNLVRRVVAIESSTPARLRLHCLRLGQSRPVTLSLQALTDSPDTATREARHDFRQALISAAHRDWTGWNPAPLPRRAAHATGLLPLLFRRGRSLAPCLAVPGEDAAAAGPALAQLLALAAQVREQHPHDVIAALRLVIPAAAAATVAQRRRWLLPPGEAAPLEAYFLDRSAGILQPLPLEAEGNLASRLLRAPRAQYTPEPSSAEAALLRMIRTHCPQATAEPAPSGSGCIFRLYGLDFARSASGAEALLAPFTFGCGRERSPLMPATQPLFEHFLHELGSQRLPGGSPRDPWYAPAPERWMEHLLRAELDLLDPSFQVDRRFVYSQVPAWDRDHRDVIDLLAVDRDARLLVVELKASEDLDLPLQALDYWMRVRQHQLAGDFERLGYFPGIALSPLPPRLWLVAPALRWHPHIGAVARWIVPAIEGSRIGLNEEWRKAVQVVDRKRLQDPA